MGCICSKTSAVEDSREDLTKKGISSRRGSELRVSRFDSSKRNEGVCRNDVKISLIDKKTNGSFQLYDDDHLVGNKEIEKPELTVLNNPKLGKVPKAVEGEQAAAGWPSWLSSVAGEAINGWIPRSANTFERLNKVSYSLSIVHFTHSMF